MAAKISNQVRKLQKVELDPFEFNRQRALKEKQAREKLESEFKNRVDKSILWPVYAKDEKLFAKYALGKFKLNKQSVSPFINHHSLHNDIVA